MEGVVSSSLFDNTYRGRRVLVTGHTGFKGSWLSLWLQRMGAVVAGIALDPDEPSHWRFCTGLGIGMAADHRMDIVERERLALAVQEFAPEIVFHLAAQPLVRRSYAEPVDTWMTNVMGTVNLLDACRSVPDLKAIVVVTSDKCYDNRSLSRGYREDDPLGGFDPYSASKAATELAAASYRSSFFSADSAPLLATARAGNVIGGGDWGEDRLIPDLYRAVAAGSELEIRSPDATRPWQHVLDALSGYLLLGQRLLAGERAAASAWNFGPETDGACRVIDVLKCMKTHWPDIGWHLIGDPQPHEAALLQLDCDKAKCELGWRPVWGLDRAIAQTALWYKTFLKTGEAISSRQLDTFIADAGEAEACWS